jgi:O-methyltransferase
VQGLFKDTLRSVPDVNSSILRRDGVLNSSTTDIPNNLSNKVVPSGFVIVEDYGTLIDH